MTGPRNVSLPPDAHAHACGGSPACDGVFRLWNIGEPVAPAPDGFFYSAGIHPQDAMQYAPSEFAPLWDSPRCLAVGECGLDRTAEPPLTRQTEVFRAQIEEAVRRDKPLVIHCVRCFPELLRLKSNAGADSVPWVLHGFRGAKRKAFELLDAGFVLSFGSGLLRDAGNMEYFAEIPLDRILIETDESADDFPRILAEASALHLLPPSEFAQTVRDNFRRFFRHDPD